MTERKQRVVAGRPVKGTKRPKSYHVSTVVTEEYHELVKAYCDEQDRSQAWVLRKALEAFLDKEFNR